MAPAQGACKNAAATDGRLRLYGLWRRPGQGLLEPSFLWRRRMRLRLELPTLPFRPPKRSERKARLDTLCCACFAFRVLLTCVANDAASKPIWPCGQFCKPKFQRQKETIHETHNLNSFADPRPRRNSICFAHAGEGGEGRLRHMLRRQLQSIVLPGWVRRLLPGEVSKDVKSMGPDCKLSGPIFFERAAASSRFSR
jgi:hypothetical protein